MRHSPAETLDELSRLLAELRTRSSPQAWGTFCGEFSDRYPVLWQHIQRDPFTRHSVQRPRGYPGDAVLIDYIYDRQAGSEACPIGLPLFRYATDVPLCRSVRARRDYFTSAIDEAAGRREGARVLSMACGHLRGAPMSKALRQGGIAEVVAMDQDEQSLAEVERACAGLPVRTLRGSVQQWLRNRIDLGGFDLVYAAGLYDYLNRPLGTALTAKLFDAVRPAGQLVIANFLPNVPDVGYMECCMDWWLVYRSESDMGRLLERIPAEEIDSVRMDYEPHGNIVFLVVEKQ